MQKVEDSPIEFSTEEAAVLQPLYAKAGRLANEANRMDEEQLNASQDPLAMLREAIAALKRVLHEVILTRPSISFFSHSNILFIVR